MEIFFQFSIEDTFSFATDFTLASQILKSAKKKALISPESHPSFVLVRDEGSFMHYTVIKEQQKETHQSTSKSLVYETDVHWCSATVAALLNRTACLKQCRKDWDTDHVWRKGWNDKLLENSIKVWSWGEKTKGMSLNGSKNIYKWNLCKYANADDILLQMAHKNLQCISRHLTHFLLWPDTAMPSV